jgi:non-ribosomal peptide synthetase component F
MTLTQPVEVSPQGRSIVHRWLTIGDSVVDTYVRLLETFAANPYTSIDQCSLHADSQIKEALTLGNGPQTAFSWPATLSERFQDIAASNGTAPAVKCGEKTLTYTHLAGLVNSTAKALQSAGCTQSKCVGVLCEPSLDSVVAMLAILQAGCVYLPLDTSLPKARHAAMVQNAEPYMILCHAATEVSVLELVNETSVMFQELRIDNISNKQNASAQPIASDANAAAILLYTSGSTGTPKGVRLTQGNFANHLALKTQILGLGQETVLQQSSLGFDMSIVQTFCDIRRDPIALAKLIHDQDISLTIATPSEYLAWSQFGFASLQGRTGWRHACMGGEAVTGQLKREFIRLGINGLRLTNCYGPTEATAGKFISCPL